MFLKGATFALENIKPLRLPFFDIVDLSRNILCVVLPMGHPQLIGIIALVLARMSARR
jgi:hypothetical protein